MPYVHRFMCAGHTSYQYTSASKIVRYDVLGVNVAAVDYEQAVNLTIDAASEDKCFTLAPLPVHPIALAAVNPEHRDCLNRMDLLTPDGQPVRWALNRLYKTKLKDRVYGPTLMLHLCEAAEREGFSIYLYGSTASTLIALSDRLIRRFPNLQIAAAEAPPFRELTEREMNEAAERVAASGARLLFVGLGCPKQELWIDRMRHRIQCPMIAVGAAFDFHAGRKRQAPPWMQKRGLEWLFRLSREPRRLWKRYMLYNPLFVILIARQAIRSRKSR